MPTSTVKRPKVQWKNTRINDNVPENIVKLQQISLKEAAITKDMQVGLLKEK